MLLNGILCLVCPRDDRPKMGETPECPQTHFLDLVHVCKAVRAPFSRFPLSAALLFRGAVERPLV